MRVLVAVSVLPIVILANGLRVAGAGVLAHAYGAAAAAGFLHSFAGWIFFAAAVLMLATVERAAVALSRSRSVRRPPSASVA